MRSPEAKEQFLAELAALQTVAPRCDCVHEWKNEKWTRVRTNPECPTHGGTP